MKNFPSIALILAIFALAFFLGKSCQPKPETRTVTVTETKTEVKWDTATIEVVKWYPSPAAERKLKKVILKTEEERDEYLSKLNSTSKKLQAALLAIENAKGQAARPEAGLGSGSVGSGTVIQEDIPVTSYVGDTTVVQVNRETGDTLTRFRLDWNIPVIGELYDAPRFGFTWPVMSHFTETKETVTIDDTRKAAWLLEFSVLQDFEDGWDRNYLPQLGRRKGRFYAKTGALIKESGGLRGASLTGGVEF